MDLGLPQAESYILSSDAKLFADYCLVYQLIRNQRNAAKLQEDLTALEGWEHRWQMSFHPEKCTVIRVSNKRQPLQTSCTLHGHQLEVVESGKYLGVTIFQDLQWTNHINTTIDKAIRKLGFLRRNLGQMHTISEGNSILYLDQKSNRVCFICMGPPPSHTHQRS